MNQKLKLAGAALAGMVATLAAGGVALASMDQGLGRIGGADANKDGQITRAEWIAAANWRFDRLDADKDGKLVTSELPRRRGHGHHRGPHDRRTDGAWNDAAPAPPAAAQPAVPAPAAPQE